MPPRQLVIRRDLFKHDLEKRRELIRLRGVERWATPRLATYFAVDRTTIRYNLVRFAPHLVGTMPLTEKSPLDLTAPPFGKKPTAKQIRDRRKAMIAGVRLKDWVDTMAEEVDALPPVPRVAKYAALIEEPVNEGRSYMDYRAQSHARRRESPEHKALMARLRAEHQERVKRRGSLLTAHDQQIIARQFSDGSMLGRERL